jgi:hypothetical protein
MRTSRHMIVGLLIQILDCTNTSNEQGILGCFPLTLQVCSSLPSTGIQLPSLLRILHLFQLVQRAQLKK